jgi:hypothetical protein
LEVRRVFTIVLMGGGRLDEPCVAACPALGLRTDAPTAARALEAMTRALQAVEQTTPTLPDRPESEPSAELRDATAASGDEPVLPPSRRAGLAALYDAPLSASTRAAARLGVLRDRRAG